MKVARRSIGPMLLGLTALIAGTLVGGTASAADGASFFKDKTVRIVVGYGPGGGYDAYARMLAPHLKKVLDATVIVENQPGAGGLSALNRLYIAPPDGLQMMLIQGTGAALSQIVGLPAVRFDLAKLGYLGIVSASPWVWLASAKTKIMTVADALKPGLKMSFGASGQIDGLSDGAAITCATLNLDCRIVRSYKGSSAVALALAQGEMDMEYVSDTSANHYVQAGDARALASMGRVKSRFFPNQPTIFDAVKLSPEQQWWFDFRATLDALGRILVVPPGMAKNRLAELQAAFKKVLTDPAVIAEGEKYQRYIDYVDPEKTRQMVHSVVASLTPAQKEQAIHIIIKKY